MKIVTHQTIMALDNARQKALLHYREVTEIYETDICFSFRVFTDDGSKTLFFHRWLKNQLNK